MAAVSSIKDPIQILCVGPTSSGKTMLIKCLSHFVNNKITWQIGEIPPHAATLGVDITTLNLQKHKAKENVEIKELGGQLAPIWKSYYTGIAGVIFTVDSSNPFQIADATVELGRCLKNFELKNTRILVVFTKSDIPREEYSATFLQNMMLLDDLIGGRNSSIKVDILTDFSALTFTNVQKIVHWIERTVFA